MFKDIVVPIAGVSGDTAALTAAIGLATSFDAYLAVLEMINLPVPAAGPWGVMPDLAITDIYGKLRAMGEDNVAKLKLRLEKETILSEVRLVESLFVECSRIAACCARYADLTVVAGSTGDVAGEALTREYFSSLLLESGRPVLVVPPHCHATMPPRRVVVAWWPTREATRALHDAMPLLMKAEIVDIVVVNPVGGETGHGEQPGADIATHLARHGVKVNVVVRDAGGEAVSSTLLDHAYQTHADMLVTGGYGHSRLREWALGGVTRELLNSAPIPVFYSH